MLPGSVFLYKVKKVYMHLLSADYSKVPFKCVSSLIGENQAMFQLHSMGRKTTTELLAQFGSTSAPIIK